MILPSAGLATERDEALLPDGVARRPIRALGDARGSFAEIFRESWAVGVAPVQWGLLKSEAGVLRGVHAHPRHDEFIIVTQGSMLLGLKDARRRSPTFGRSVLLALSGKHPELVTLPRGVAHGFFQETDGSLLLGASSYYDPTDDIGCHWADPELGIAWPFRNPVLSERDRTAAPFAALLATLDRSG